MDTESLNLSKEEAVWLLQELLSQHKDNLGSEDYISSLKEKCERLMKIWR